MLSTVLNIIMFEDCRNQWSMSRPLLGLILLNEEVSTLLYCSFVTFFCLLNVLVQFSSLFKKETSWKSVCS